MRSLQRFRTASAVPEAGSAESMHRRRVDCAIDVATRAAGGARRFCSSRAAMGGVGGAERGD
jgi:hypothetical protein